MTQMSMFTADPVPHRYRVGGVDVEQAPMPWPWHLVDDDEHQEVDDEPAGPGDAPTWLEHGRTRAGEVLLMVHTAHATPDCGGIGPGNTLERRRLADNTGDSWCPLHCMDTLRGIGDTRRPETHPLERGDSIDPPDRNQTGTSGTSRHLEVDDRTWTSDEVGALTDQLDRKFEVADMTTGLVEFAAAWLADWNGDFEFLADLQASKRPLTAGQAKGVLNCWRADQNRTETTETGTPTGTDLDLADVPAGRYADPAGGTRLKIMIEHGTRGKWAGWTFVKDAAEYGAGRRYGTQRPNETYRGDIADTLARIAADPYAASAAYGRLTSTCGRCGRPLEDADSVARGIGPICADKF